MAVFVVQELIGTPSHSGDPDTGRPRPLAQVVDITSECGANPDARKLIKYVRMQRGSFLIEFTRCAPGDLRSGHTTGFGMNLAQRPETIIASSDENDSINKIAREVGITPERLEELIWEHAPQA